jgi:hypothetical protein
VSIYSGDTSGDAGDIVVKGGSTGVSSSIGSNVNITAGYSAGTGGGIYIASGLSKSTASGAVTIRTANAGTSGASGSFSVFTGVSSSGSSGSVSLSTGVASAGSGGNVSVQLLSGTGTDQGGDPYSFTGLATPINDSSYAPTTGFVRLQYTGTVASSAKELAMAIAYTPTGTAGADDAIYITGVQLEQSNVMTGFTPAGGTFQGELAACQRYLPSIRGQYSTLDGFFGSTTGGVFNYNFPVEARVAPTGITVSNVADWGLVTPSVGTGATTAIAWNYGGVNGATVSTTHTAGTPTTAAKDPGILRCTGASGFILFTGCEL